MFKHLLVPLDGSRLAEAALPAAAFLAARLGASVTLIHIIEHDAPQEVHGEHHLTSGDEACAYLEAAARHMQEHAPGVTLDVERHVHTAEMKDVAQGHRRTRGGVGARPDRHVHAWHGRPARRVCSATSPNRWWHAGRRRLS